VVKYIIFGIVIKPSYVFYRLKWVKVIKGSYDPLKWVKKLDTLHFHVPHIKLRGYVSLTQIGHQIPTGPPFSDI